MTVDRLARAIVVLGELIDPDDEANAHPFDKRLDAIKSGLLDNHPAVRRAADVVQKVVSTYLGDDLELHARELITTVANTGRAKLIRMFVVEGPGMGPWECVVRRNREDPSPAFLKPGQEPPRIILPTGFKRS